MRTDAFARTLAPSLVALAATLAGGCSIASFQRATGEFANATTVTTAAVAGEFDVASALCRKRARLDFLQRRIQPNATWGAAPFWREWYASQPLDPQDAKSGTWKSHCESIESVEPIYRKGVTLLAAYGQALAALSATGCYDGADLRDIAKDASSLAKTATAPSWLASGMGAIGDPITKIADFLFAARTNKEMRDAVAQADPAVQSLIAGLRSYAAATDNELRDADARLDGVLMTLDIRMAAFAPTLRQLYHVAKSSGAAPGAAGARPDATSPAYLKALEDEIRKGGAIDPMHAVAYYRFASAEEDELRSLHRAQAALGTTLDGLAHAHELLSRAASGHGHEVEDDIKKALGFTAAVLHAAQSATHH